MEVDDDLFEVAYWKDTALHIYSTGGPGRLKHDPRFVIVELEYLRYMDIGAPHALCVLRDRYRVPNATLGFFIRLFSERNRFRFMCMLLIEQNKTPAGEPAGDNTRKDQHESQCAAIDSTPDTSVNSFYQRSDLTFKPVADSSKPTQQ